MRKRGPSPYRIQGGISKRDILREGEKSHAKIIGSLDKAAHVSD